MKAEHRVRSFPMQTRQARLSQSSCFDHKIKNVRKGGRKLQLQCASARQCPSSEAVFSRRQIAAIYAASLAVPPARAGPLPNFFQQSQSAEPIRFPRNKLDLRFAVLMMHSVYEAVDQCNIVPTSDFQSSFWKRRQKEYEPYLAQYAPLQIKQGDLTDPLYFDFISFAQAKGVGHVDTSIKYSHMDTSPAYVCCLQVSTVVDDILSRAPAAQRAGLLMRIENRIGDLIFEGMRDGFREETFNGPSELPAGTHLNYLVKGVQQILDIFVQKGFALKAATLDVSAACKESSCDYHGADGSRGSFTIRVDGPADLWGMSTANARKSKLLPDFVGFAVDGFLRASQTGPTHTASPASAAITQKWLLT